MKLIGKVEICNFMGKGWPIIEKLIISQDFPAKMIDGRWEADTDQITTWRGSQQKSPGQHNSEGRV